MTSLNGRTAWVIGGAGRLGPVWCKALETAGARVSAVGPPIVDVTDRRSLLTLFGTPDVLVVNAGVDDRPVNGSNRDPVELAYQMAEVNLVGCWNVLTTIGARMAELNCGKPSSIICVASLYGLVAPDDKLYSHLDGFHKHPMYGATKAGIISLVKYFAAFYGPQGTRVNAVAPGGVLNDGDGLTGSDEQFKAKYTAKIPMGRMCRPDDLAGPLIFLASDASSFVTGQTLPIDGGFTCW